MPTTIEQNLELDIVNPTNANAYWTRQDNQSGYQGVYRFTNGVHPHSLMVFKGVIPPNINASPNWNLVIHHAGQAAAGNALVRVEVEILASGDTPAAPIVIVANKLVGVGASGDHNRTLLAGVAGVSNFDAVAPLVASAEIRINFMRAPNASSGDNASANWDLKQPLILRCDVD